MFVNMRTSVMNRLGRIEVCFDPEEILWDILGWWKEMDVRFSNLFRTWEFMLIDDF